MKITIGVVFNVHNINNRNIKVKNKKLCRLSVVEKHDGIRTQHAINIINHSHSITQ